MAEALLSAVFNVLLERLTPDLADLINLICGKKLDNKLLQRLKPSLIAARAVLNDAELKQFTDPNVKDWLDELKDAAYDLDDFMDEISTRAATQKKVPCFSFSSLSLGDTNLGNDLEDMIDRIEHIVALKDVLALKKTSGKETLSWRPPVMSHVNVPRVYGREKEKQDLIKLMFNNDDGYELSVIPVVGMGGVGKTTLVRLVFNDNDVKQKFDITAWVCVSEAFDHLKIVETIIKYIDPDFVCDNMDVSLLQHRLAEKLEGKRFLIVLDDVWNDKVTDWDTVKYLVWNKVEGCKILVTTRDASVASVAKSVASVAKSDAVVAKTISSFYCLNVLSDEDCLSIFAAHAFHSRDSTLNSRLEKIGSDIAGKCKGLPLAAKVLGGLFRSKPDFEDWNNVLNDSMWDSSDNEIIPALRVSYYYLPPHLKQCFAFCSLFPKDYQFRKEQLILMWMAEGFLHPPKRNMTLEKAGSMDFDDLTSRSFFQPIPNDDECFWLKGRDERFVMHDLIHDLATHVAGDFYFQLEKNGSKIDKKTRHLSCNYQNHACLDHEFFKKIKSLRTFIGLGYYRISPFVGNVSHILLSNMKCLRMLSLRGLRALRVVPESIGELIHLRYLDLSDTSIESLPGSICKMYNLQTLKLRSCMSLEMLPNEIQDLANLRHLDLSWSVKIASLPKSLCKLYNLQTLKLEHCHSLQMLPSDTQDLVNLWRLDVKDASLKEMPRGLGKLKNLQFLSDFVVGKEQGIEIGELGEMPNLKGWITIKKLENVKDGNEAFEARMMEKEHIKDLTLSWSGDADVEDVTQRDILDKLQPYWDLEGLEIWSYRGTTFPDWLGSPGYHYMTWLQLVNCENCCMLPPLGQLPALKTLYMRGLKRIEKIGEELLKASERAPMIPFPALECLGFSFMTSWKEWHSIDVEAFPELRCLKIWSCPKLVGNLPSQLLSLKTLRMEYCPLLASSIPRCPEIQDLVIVGCRSVGWQEQELPRSLRRLGITGCRMLESMLEALSKHLHLQELSISECSNTSHQMIHLPPSLQQLEISDCQNVDFVLSSTAPLQNLQSLTIGQGCNFVKFMSDDMEDLLPNLKDLWISSCEEMEAFPEGILVPSLRELHIEVCHKLLSHQAEWRLLTNITLLYILGSDVKCFPEGFSLPATLTTLELYYFDDLETLDCTGLEHLTSLQQLYIMYCDKLEKLSGKNLPPSIRELCIEDCPLLEEQYRKKDEGLMRRISHIQRIQFF
ncbi:putative disease resistance protein At3g14460 [Prosopis cineraria]|uniref:putative disease resistance protein At3g14460 n=1 Tax=Prosopis cineraria TaxID=364024 RepID=UPI00240F71DF|nr:putative disease resistance protein At3g14460 [Prosopis cineraria]